MNSYYDALKNQLVKNVCIEESHFYFESLENVKETEGHMDFPVVLFESTDYWKSNGDQSNIDLTKEIRANTDMKFYFFTSDEDELTRFEEFFRDFYCRQQSLSDFSDDGSVKYTTVSLKQGVEPEHHNKKEFYQFEATLYIKDFIQEGEVFNPIQIEWNMPTQKKVMSHLSMVNEAWRNIFSDKKKITDSDESKDQYDLYSQQLSALQKQVADVYNFKNLTKVELSLGNDGFLKCYELMCTQDLTITEASEILQKQMIQEQEREKEKAKENARKAKEAKEREIAARNAAFNNKKQNSTGTAGKSSSEKSKDLIDKYTDSIVNDFKKKVNYPVSVYGGSTFRQYFSDYQSGRLKFPNILVQDNVWVADVLRYPLQTAKGQQKLIKASMHDLPIDYNVVFYIYTETEEQLFALERKVLNTYSYEKVFKVPNPKYVGNYCLVTFSVNKEEEPTHKVIQNRGKRIYVSVIVFNTYSTVYYVTNPTKDALKNNPRLQWIQLVVAEGYMGAIDVIDKVIIKELDKLQELMTTNQKGAFNRLINGSDYMELNRCFLNHQPIRRELFEKEFSRIIKYHPNLYDQITSGKTSVLEIKNSAIRIKKDIEARVQQICVNVGIPVIIPGFEKENGRSRDALRFYIQEMASGYATSKEAADMYAEHLWQEMEAQREEEYDDYYSSGGGSSSRGMGFFGTAAATTAGSWLGTTGIRREERRQTEMMREEINRQKEHEKEMARKEHTRREEEQRRETYRKQEQAKKDQMDRLHRSQEEYRRKAEKTREEQRRSVERTRDRYRR